MHEISKEDAPVTQLSDDRHLLTFNENVYSLDAVKKAAYKFAASFVATIDRREPYITVSVEFNGETTRSDQAELLNHFRIEVSDQDLRELIARETEGTRNLILAEAFSRTSLLHVED